MEYPDDPLTPYPALRALRDAILIRDPDARNAGPGLITRTLLAATLQVKVPPDRLLSTPDAARLLGITDEEFDQLAYRKRVKPVHVLPKNSYWRARDVYGLAEE